MSYASVTTLFARTPTVSAMYLFCPRCNTQHLASSRCPRCSSRLLSPGEASDLLPTQHAAAPPPPPATPGFGGRIVVGSLVALGMHLAIWEWAFAAAGVVGLTDLDWHLWLGLALRVVGTLVGGVLAGAGRLRSFSTGAFVGAVSAVAWLAVDAYPHVVFDVVRLVAAGALVVLGGSAAVVGGVIWPPPVEVKPPESSRNSSLFKLKTSDGTRQGKPVAWVRAGIAAAVAVCGVLAAELIRQVLAKMPQGTFNVDMTARSDAILAGFVAIVAGVVAGATTGRGWRQGAISGLAAGLVVMSISATMTAGPPLPVQFIMDACGLESPGGGVAIAGVALFAVVTLGGWFGGQLFPVLRRKPRLGN